MKYLVLFLLVSCGVKIPAEQLSRAFIVCETNEKLKEIYVDEDLKGTFNAHCNNGAKFNIEHI